MTLGSARADWRLDAQTGALYESNLSNSDQTSDEKDDWAWKTEAGIGNGIQLTHDLRLNLGADFRSLVWSQYDGFDQVGAGVSASLRYRFGLGLRAPWLLLEERIGYDSFRETFLSNWDESLRLRGGLALSSRVALEAGYTFENFAGPGNFFDRQGNRADVRMVFDLTERLQIGIGYSYRDGDIISYAVPPRPELLEIGPVRRSVTIFGTNPPYNAYRIRAETHAVSIVAGYSLTKNLSLQLAYEFGATAHAPLRYQNHVVEAKIAFAY